jgi:predicted NBD/HSP70 family sugar kinase
MKVGRINFRSLFLFSKRPFWGHNLMCYDLDMYLGIDIGGTKTLIAKINDQGVILKKDKFHTPPKYSEFMDHLKNIGYTDVDYRAACVAAPGNIDRQNGIVANFGNLNWKNIHLARDIEKVFECPTLIENDAKLAALSEAMLVKEEFKRVLYVTVSTGIGYAFVDNLKIDTNAGDTGGRAILFSKDKKQMPWEDYVSGRAIVDRFGKKAKDINDPNTWKIISKDLRDGLVELIAIFEPEIIILGGSVGVYFDKYGTYLREYIERAHIPMVTLPKIIKAQRPEEAVIFGCYDYLKQNFNS